jgi:phosphoenolpyruvate---glycerone phosphotransferase subunit DhaK
MKKLINAVENVLTEQLQGMALAHPELKISLDPKYIVRVGAPFAGKVAVISGGGSGHEPLHGGFVGVGMLTAACPGEVFTSPTPDQMYEAAKAAASDAGVLFIVKNYTGDVLNFETAAEMVHSEGIKVQNVIVDDDVAVKDSLFTAGRRGVGTTVILEKIVGAAAEAGYDLDQCAELARKVNRNGRSMGMALTSCTVPAAGKPTFTLAEDEVEIGVGIHGEPGQYRAKLRPLDEIAETLAKDIFEDGAYKRTLREWDRENGTWIERDMIDDPLQKGDQVIVLVNSMGGTPLSELYAAYRKLASLCSERGITIARKLVGPYITSLEMQGFSITVVKADDEMLRFWDAPVHTPALRWGM